VDTASGNVSHLSQSRTYRTADQQQVIAARDLRNKGGNLVKGHHFENWGRPDHTLASDSFRVNRAGRFLVRAEFSNGAGPVNTGITCAVKRLEIRKAATGDVVAAGYLVMPQSGDWTRYDLSSAVEAALDPGQDYQLRICEDEYCRNMSYLGSNIRYTANPGGGDDSYNYVNISAVRLLYAGPAKTTVTAAGASYGAAGAQNGAVRP
jgi:hypothetical protein